MVYIKGVIAVFAKRKSRAATISSTIITGSSQYFLFLKMNLNILPIVLAFSFIVVLYINCMT